jgi:Mg-chelatase subunit ChlD
VVDGTYFNIRAFQLPYADYRAAFKDNPFILKVTQKPLEGPPEGNFMKDTVDAFKEIATAGQGELVWSTGADDVVPKIKKILEEAKGKRVDLVIAFDTTSSMKDDIDSVRRMLIPMLKDILKDFASFRIGIVLYKDYFEDYLNRVVPFTEDFSKFQATLNGIRVSGGRDIPEAVHEALYEAAVKFPWEAEERLIILIGDAPPHPRQRGSISKDMVDKAVLERELKVNAIILPQ